MHASLHQRNPGVRGWSTPCKAHAQRVSLLRESNSQATVRVTPGDVGKWWWVLRGANAVCLSLHPPNSYPLTRDREA